MAGKIAQFSFQKSGPYKRRNTVSLGLVGEGLEYVETDVTDKAMPVVAKKLIDFMETSNTHTEASDVSDSL